jgi:polyisoprenoid-binding protein YceI
MAVKKLGDSVAFTMLDDQKTVMHISPVDSDGNPTSLPSGSTPPTYAASDATVTLDPTIDPTGLSCAIIGVKKTAGTPTVTASFTNADGTVATGSLALTITLDPAELDVTSFAVTADPAVAQ